MKMIRWPRRIRESYCRCPARRNLLAFEDTEKHRIGSDEALEALDDKIRLQSWLNQVAQVEQLFEPLAEPLARMHRAASDLNDVDGRAFTKVCIESRRRRSSSGRRGGGRRRSLESTALAVVPGSPADESYDFGLGDASRPESPARIAWEPPPSGAAEAPSTCPSGGRGGRPCRACPGRCSTSSTRRRRSSPCSRSATSHAGADFGWSVAIDGSTIVRGLRSDRAYTATTRLPS